MPSAGSESRRNRARRAERAPIAEADEAGPPRPLAYASLRTWLGLALAAVATWWMVLFWMAIATANPVTLNYRQIAESPHVVTATVADPEAGRLRVDRDWRFATPGEIVVRNLAETGARPGERYVVPLRPVGTGEFEVTPVVLPRMDESDEHREHPVVYPVTDETISRLKAILVELDVRSDGAAEPSRSIRP